MAEVYTIAYAAENVYEHPVIEACWQFLIVPEENTSQAQVSFSFQNSAGAPWERSSNGFGFTTIRVRNRHALERISFRAEFRVTKTQVNPFDFNGASPPVYDPKELHDLDFRLQFSTYLRPTPLTLLPPSAAFFRLTEGVNLLDNLKALNLWVYEDLKYTPGLTHVDTQLEEILEHRQGVCQDFAHLFVAIARYHGLPARYVSGYLHQGLGFFGDAQMHAWAEVWVPGIGWIGFDPTNNILAASDHIKVAHGRDYSDCAPIKGVLYGPGTNTSMH